MAWTTPRTWSAGETVTSSIMNIHVRDNLNYLYSELLLDPGRLVLHEDFVTGQSATSGSIGVGGWFFYTSSGGTTAGGSDDGGRPGQQRILSGATASAVSCLYPHASAYNANPESIERAFIEMKSLTDWPMAIRASLLTSSVASLAVGAITVAFECLAADANWFSYTSDGSTATRKDTGVAKVLDWNRFEIRNAGARSWDFYIDGTFVTNHTGAGDNVPLDNAACQLCVPQIQSTGSTMTMRVDRCMAWAFAR